MARTGRASGGGRKVTPAAPADLLIERETANGSRAQKAPARPETGVGGKDEDRSVANIHTGARADHAPASAAVPTGLSPPHSIEGGVVPPGGAASPAAAQALSHGAVLSVGVGTASAAGVASSPAASGVNVAAGNLVLAHPASLRGDVAAGANTPGAHAVSAHPEPHAAPAPPLANTAASPTAPGAPHTSTGTGATTGSGESTTGAGITHAPATNQGNSGDTTTNPPSALTPNTDVPTATTPDTSGSSSTTSPIVAITAMAGAEDTAIPLVITVLPSQGSVSQTITVVIDGIPAGATLTAGERQPDGTWIVAGGELDGLHLVPAPDFNGDIPLSLTITTQGGEIHNTQTAALNIHVVPVPDEPSVVVGAASGSAGQPITLDIHAALNHADASGELLVAIAGLPPGATLSVGAPSPDGAWIIAADQLDGLQLVPPPGAAGSFTLTVTPIAVGSDEVATSGPALPLIVGINPVAVVNVDAAPPTGISVIETPPVEAPPVVAPPAEAAAVTVPTLSISAAVGVENGVIPLDIAAGLGTPVVSQHLSVTVSGLPEGAILSAGLHNSDGTWTLTGDQLTGLTLAPAPNSGEDFTLTITATASDVLLGTSTSTTASLPVTVVDVVSPPVEMPAVAVPVVVAPTLSVSAAIGVENGIIPLDIATGLGDLAGIQILTVTIAGLPEGATLSAGLHNSDGTWTLAGDQLSGLTLIPAPDSGQDFILAVTATVGDALLGTMATTSASLPVTVADVVIAQPIEAPAVVAPTLSVSAATGIENGVIPLDIATGLGGFTASETLAVTVNGLPEGAALSAGLHNPDGSWTLTGDQLAGLTLTPAPGSGKDFTLSVTATLSDSLHGTMASTNATLPVTVVDVIAAPSVEVPTLVAPTLSVSAAAGIENGIIPLDIAAGLGGLTVSETLAVTVNGLPEGATLSAGLHNPDGSWTLTGNQLAGLTLTPAPDSGEDFTLSVTAMASDAVLGTTASTSATLPVMVADVAPPFESPVVEVPTMVAPTLSVSAAVGIENGVIPLDIATGLSGLGGTETLSVTIAGLPEGAALSAGVHNADGSWTLTGDQLAGLTLTPAPDSSEDFALTVTATVHDALTGTEASASNSLPVTVADVAAAPLADVPTVVAPTLSVSAAAGVENGIIPLDIATGLAGLAGTATLSVIVAGLPEGATLSAGLHNPDGSWTLTGNQLAGLTLTPAPDSGEDFTLSVTATVSDTILGITASSSATLPVTVADVVVIPPVEVPTLIAPTLSVSAAAGVENGIIPLDIATGLTGLAGTATLSVIVAGLPEGATLSAGVHNADGSWTLTGDQLAGLTLTPAPDSGQDFTLSVTAMASDAVLGTTASTITTLPVVVADIAVAPPVEVPIVVAPTLSVSAALGVENGVIPLDIAAGLSGVAATESLTVTVVGLPEGATLSAGLHNADGSWVLSGDQLTGLTLSPPPDSGENFMLAVTATASNAVLGTTATTSATLPVTVVNAIVAPSVDIPAVTSPVETPANAAILAEVPMVVAPTLSVSAAAGTENGVIPLDITTGLTGLAGTATLSVIVAGLPGGATLSAGVHNADGSWTLTSDQLTGLTLTPAPDSSEDFALTVTATAHNTLTGTDASASGTLPVTVADVAAPVEVPTLVAPVLSVSAAAGAENGVIPLGIETGLNSMPASESLSIAISGLPEGATLSAGLHNPDGTWTLSGDQLASLTLTPAPNSGEDFALTVTATVSNAVLGTTMSTTVSLPVTVADSVALPAEVPTIVAPTLSVSAAAGVENGVIPLDIATGLTGLAGTATLSVIVAGLPEGATLSAGIHNTDGSWTLTGDQLTGLTLTPAPDSSEDFALTVTATAHNTLTGTEASASGTVPITVADVAAPVVLSPVVEPVQSIVDAVTPIASDLSITATASVGTNQTLSTNLAVAQDSSVPIGTADVTTPSLATGDLPVSVPALETTTTASVDTSTVGTTMTAHDTLTGTESSASGTVPGTVADVAAPIVLSPLVEPVQSIVDAVTPIPADLPTTATVSVVVQDSSVPIGTADVTAPSSPTGDLPVSAPALETTTTASVDTSSIGTTMTGHDTLTGTEASASGTLPVTVADVAVPVVLSPVVEPVQSIVDAVTPIAPDPPTTTTVSVEANQTHSANLVVAQDSSVPMGTVGVTAPSSPAGDLPVSAPALETTTTANVDTSSVGTTMTAHDALTGTEASATLPVTVADAVTPIGPDPPTTTTVSVEANQTHSANLVVAQDSSAPMGTAGVTAPSSPAGDLSVSAPAPVLASTTMAGHDTSVVGTHMSDAEFLYALDQLATPAGSSVRDTISHLDPVVTVDTSLSATVSTDSSLIHTGTDATAAVFGSADSGQPAVTEHAAAPTPVPPPPEPAIPTASFTPTAPLL